MRILEFDIDKQNIRKSPTCDFSGLVAGTTGYLYATFNFSHDWIGYAKVAVFESGDAKKPVVIQMGRCEIPSEVLANESFTICIIGKNKNKRLNTSKVTIMQRRY